MHELLLTRRNFLRASGIIIAAAACDSLPIGQPQPEFAPKLELPGVSDLDFPLSGDMHLYRGPHHISDDNGIPSGIDLYSPDKNAKIVAAHYGKVIYAGEVMADKSINQTLHSIVEIDVGDGYRLQYVHVGNIRVKVGDTVHRGDVLGEQSMEVPAGYLDAENVWIEPKSDRIHLHLGIKRYEKAINIIGKSIAGWIIRGDGTMSKEDKYAAENYTVTAYIGLCGPSKESIQGCDGIINFMPHPKFAAPGVRR